MGKPHEIKGQVIAAFVMLAVGEEDSKELISELHQNLHTDVWKFALSNLIIVAPSLPMTWFGKIVHCILRKIVCGETDQLGDMSSLADSSIVDILIQKFE